MLRFFPSWNLKKKKSRLQSCERMSSGIHCLARSVESLIKLCCCPVSPDLAQPHNVSKQPICVFVGSFSRRRCLEWSLNEQRVHPSLSPGQTDSSAEGQAEEKAKIDWIALTNAVGGCWHSRPLPSALSWLSCCLRSNASIHLVLACTRAAAHVRVWKGCSVPTFCQTERCCAW